MARGPDFFFATEYVKNALQFAILKPGKTLTSTKDTHYFSIDDELVYENYYSDFGPLNIGCVYRYCNLVNDKLKQFLNKKIIVHYTSIDSKKRSNAAFLIGCFGVLYLSLSPKEALKPLTTHGMTYKPFQDAVMGDSYYTISLLDCLQAIKRARELEFFNFKDFDFQEYDLLNRIHGGDLNWIVPGKFLAFIGPIDANHSITIFHPPEMYIDYFIQNNVKVVVRLNKKMYEGSVFEDAGIKHYTLYFQDGGVPTRHILRKFLQISEEAKSAIAVHCKAGLGRTGSLIGCYLIKHYRMTAREAICWMRICRPGSVIGHQQGWLEEMEAPLMREGNIYRKRIYHNEDKFPRHEHGIYSFLRKAKSQQPILRSSVKEPLPPIEKHMIPDYCNVTRPYSPKQRDVLNKKYEQETIDLRMKKPLSKTKLKISITRGGGDLRSRMSGMESNKLNDSKFSSTTYTNAHPRHTHRSPTRDGAAAPTILIKNMHEAGQYLIRPNYCEEKVKHLSSAITVKPQYQNNVSISQNKNSAYVSPIATNRNVQQNRRRLGRSPSPPQVRSEQTRTKTASSNLSSDRNPTRKNNPILDKSFMNEFNALKEKAQRIKRDSDTILKEALSRLKLQMPRESRVAASSFGAGSLGAGRTPGFRHKDAAPSTRSDERPLATQGDLLNSIKYQRRLCESLQANKTFDDKKKYDSPTISDIPLITNKTIPVLKFSRQPYTKPFSVIKGGYEPRPITISKSPERTTYISSNLNTTSRPSPPNPKSRPPSPSPIRRTTHYF